MDEMPSDDMIQEPDVEAPAPTEPVTPVTRVSDADKELVKKLIRRIKADKHHHRKAFQTMLEDMEWAKHGADKNWRDGKNYTTNIIGRHVKQKTSSLYAKNPRAVARRRETIDFKLWDETQESLQLAFNVIQAGVMMAQQPVTIGPDGMAIPPQLPPGFEQAQAVVQDFQQGMMRRLEAKRIGKTLEVLFAQSLRTQQPNDFKKAMKKLVRRACTTGVGYVEIAYQRETGPRPDVENRLGDARERIAHLQMLAEKYADDTTAADECRAEMVELELMAEQLAQQPEMVLREGLVFDYPQSTTIIPSSRTTELMGFVGGNHLTREFQKTRDEVKEEFGVDVGERYTPYRKMDEKRDEAGVDYGDDSDEAQGSLFRGERKAEDMLRVWKHWDKQTGMVYWLCDGYDKFLRDPAAPDVYVNDFWPVYALTFNDVEDENSLFPPSDATLLRDPQREYNKLRQGLREHRQAARPRFVAPKGILEDTDMQVLSGMKAFEVALLNLDPAADVNKVLTAIKMPGVDPNLYETGQIFSDMQLIAGTQQAQLGGVSKATATESAIAESSASSSDGAAIDDLDGFLTDIVRAAGQILLAQMSPETVERVAGPGALWPDVNMDDIAEEIFLDVEAGSSGKPNQAVEINNWSKMLPFLVQMPGLTPGWLARETVRRLDDRADLTEAIAQAMPSIAAQNQMAQAGAKAEQTAQDPGNAPGQQGDKGADNAPKPAGGPPGSGPAFGSNQV